MKKKKEIFTSVRAFGMLFCRAQIIKKLHTVKPPVRDHLKCEDLLVAYGR